MAEIKKLLKNRNNKMMLVILIIGLVLIMLARAGDKGKEENSFATDYYGGEEARLSEILSEIKGAGRVSVMISYERDGERDGFGYSNEKVTVKPKGVIVIADGAKDADVRNDLKNAAVAVTCVGANRVCVYERAK